MWYQSPKTLTSVYFGSLVLAAASIHFSPSLASIAVILMIVSGLVFFFWEAFERSVLWFQAAFIGLMVIMLGVDCYAGTSIRAAWSALQVMLPWFFIPFIFVIPSKSNVASTRFFLALALPLWWIAGASLINYLRDWRFLSQMVLESKPLPLFTQVYHIEFSLLITAVLLGMTLFFPRLSNPKNRLVFMVLYGLLFLSLHIISARTGLLGYWLGIFIWGLFQIKSKSLVPHVKPRYVIIGLAVLGFLMVQIPSVKNRILNTQEDLAALWSGGDLNHKSVGQRVEAWKATWGIFESKKQVFLGVGSEKFESELLESYERQKTTLYVSNRIGPHNQTLQWAATYGWPVALLAWGLFIAYLIKLLPWRLVLFVGVPIIAASMFESLAQRQAGILSLLILWISVQAIESKRGIYKKIS